MYLIADLSAILGNIRVLLIQTAQALSWMELLQQLNLG